MTAAMPSPPEDDLLLPPEEVARRVAGLLEIDDGLAPGTLLAPERGKSDIVFARYLLAYVLVERFGLTVEFAAQLLGRERGTVTKALKIFRFLEGFSGWRSALETLSDLAADFVSYGAARRSAAASIPAPIGRAGQNDALPRWVKSTYAREVEGVGDDAVAEEARIEREADTLYLDHAAVRAITDDSDLKKLLGELVVSVTLAPLHDPRERAPVLLVPPIEPEGQTIALRLLMPASSPSEIARMHDARALISRALLRRGMRLTGVAETFLVRDRDGWRYVPLHIAPLQGRLA